MSGREPAQPPNSPPGRAAPSEECCGEDNELLDVCFRTGFSIDCAGDKICCPITSRDEAPADVGTEGDEGDEGDEGEKEKGDDAEPEDKEPEKEQGMTREERIRQRARAERLRLQRKARTARRARIRKAKAKVKSGFWWGKKP